MDGIESDGWLVWITSAEHSSYTVRNWWPYEVNPEWGTREMKDRNANCNYSLQMTWNQIADVESLIEFVLVERLSRNNDVSNELEVKW